MSWLYLPEQVEDSSPQNGSSSGEPYAMSKTPPTLSRSSRPGSETDSLTMLPSGTMPEYSTGDPGVDAWILSLRASRASRGVAQANGLGIKTTATSGPTPLASLTRYDRATSSWKTYQLSVALSDEEGSLSLLPTLAEFSETWPRAGTMLGGTVYPRRPLVPITRETVCGWWPTPTVADSRNTRNSTARRNTIPPTGIHAGDTLIDAVTKWPTPQSRDWKGPPGAGSQARKGRMSSLPAAVRIWPTPTARDRYSRGPSEAERNSPSLNYVATGGDGGKLNPTWVEWLMGFPIGWTDLRPLGMGRFRQWLNSFGTL